VLLLCCVPLRKHIVEEANNNLIYVIYKKKNCIVLDIYCLYNISMF
jgi:hypothetical protein